MKAILSIALLLTSCIVFAEDPAPFPTSCIWCLAKGADFKWSTQ